MKMRHSYTLLFLPILTACLVSGIASQNDLGYNVKQFLEKLKEVNQCMKHGLLYNYGEEDFGSENFKLNLKDWSLHLNFTKIKVSGKNDFDVVKSHYDNITKRFEVHVRYGGPTVIEGTYNLDTNVNISLFGIDLHQQDYDFKIQTFPFIFKIGWTFGLNESSNLLSVKDFGYKIDPVDGHRLTFAEVADIINITPDSLIDAQENVWPIGGEVVEGFHKIIETNIKELVTSTVEEFETVEEFSEIFDPDNISGLYGYLFFLKMTLCN